MTETKKKSFALGYSYIGHSFLSFCFMAFVLVAMSNVVFPDFINAYASRPDDPLWNVTTMSTANTVCAILASILGVPIGQWVDKKGAKIVLIAGYLIAGINYMVFPFAGNFVLFCICLFIAHTAMIAFTQMTASSLLAHWFNKKKGLAMGIAATGIPASNTVFLILYTSLSGSLGLRMAMWVFAFMHLAMGIISIFWVKNSPSEVGLTPDNLPLDENSEKIEDRSYKFSEVARTPLVWLGVLIYGLLNLACIACISQIINYVVDKGFTMELGTTIVSLGAIGGIIGGIIFSVIDQKLGTKLATIIYCSASVIVYLAMFFIPKNSIALVIIMCMFAFGLNGAPANLQPSMIVTMFGPENFNSVSKLQSPIGSVFRSGGYYLAAFLMLTIGRGTSWSAIYIGVAAIAAAALVLTLLYDGKRHSINVSTEDEDIFKAGEKYFGFNTGFQTDIGKIKDLLYGRNNEGKFNGELIETADVEEIVKAGIMAPADSDIKPWHFIAISDPATLKELREIVRTNTESFAVKLRARFPGHPELGAESHKFIVSLDSAPLVVLAFTDEEASDQFALAEDIKNIGSSIQNMLLKAYDKGLGSYWLTSPIAAGIAPALKDRFTEGQGEFISIVTFGYPDETHKKPLIENGYVEMI